MVIEMEEEIVKEFVVDEENRICIARSYKDNENENIGYVVLYLSGNNISTIEEQKRADEVYSLGVEALEENRQEIEEMIIDNIDYDKLEEKIGESKEYYHDVYENRGADCLEICTSDYEKCVDIAYFFNKRKFSEYAYYITLERKFFTESELKKLIDKIVSVLVDSLEEKLEEFKQAESVGENAF